MVVKHSIHRKKNFFSRNILINNLFSKNKKAIIEIQFNWIFIFIVGSVILMFFIFVGKSYLENSNLKLSGKVLYDLDSIMKGATSSSKSASNLPIPKLKLEFTCYPECSTEGCDSSFAISNTGVNKPTPHEVMFAPSNIDSDYLITWTLDWKMPFRVGNFLYLTSPDNRYIFVYDDNLLESKTMAEKLYNLFLDNEYITVELYSESELIETFESTNHEHIRFIFFYPYDTDFELDIGKSNFDIIVFHDANPSFNGNVLFLGANEASSQGDFEGSIGYFGKEAMVGAIFSEDREFFICNMHKAFNHLERIFEIYKTRAIYLKTSPGSCSSIYIYDNFAQEELPDDFGYPLYFKEEDFSIIESTLKTMASNAEKVNQNAIFNSCPRLY
jgi:hypothetical protein